MQRECEAVVVRTEPYHEGYAVVLDQTVFFPEGGGQLSDTGTLTAGEKALPVKHVHEKAGEIFHETKEPLAPGTKVVAKLDWPVRFDHMQQHCGEHMLSYAGRAAGALAAPRHPGGASHHDEARAGRRGGEDEPAQVQR